MYGDNIGFQPKNCKSGHDFELWTQGVLTALGFDAKLTGGNDNGVDIIATITVSDRDYKFYIQCKFYNRPVGKAPVQEVYTGCKYFGGDGYPVVITTNRMTSDARAYAKKMGVDAAMVSAKTGYPVLAANYYLREAFAIWYYELLEII